VELENDGKTVIANSVTLRKIEFSQGKWDFENIKTFSDENYISNIWITRIGCNNQYIVAPTQNGKTFVWNMLTRELTCTLTDHSQESEVRQALFHPSKKLFYTCGADGAINCYVSELIPKEKPKEVNLIDSQSTPVMKDNPEETKSTQSDQSQTENLEMKEKSEETKNTQSDQSQNENLGMKDKSEETKSTQSEQSQNENLGMKDKSEETKSTQSDQSQTPQKDTPNERTQRNRNSEKEEAANESSEFQDMKDISIENAYRDFKLK